jgi:hypothetical protein
MNDEPAGQGAAAPGALPLDEEDSKGHSTRAGGLASEAAYFG